MTSHLRDSDPGPGPLPPSWPSVEEVNHNRAHWHLPPIPSSAVLTETLRAAGFLACEGRAYLVVEDGEEVMG